MHVQMKGLLLIMLLPSTKALRVNRRVNLSNSLCSMGYFPCKAEATQVESGVQAQDWACNLDVSLQSIYKAEAGLVAASNDAYEVHLAPIFESCAKVQQKVQAAHRQMKEVLVILKDIKGNRMFKVYNVMPNPFQKAEFLNDRMGCKERGVPGAQPDFLRKMISKLQQDFVRMCQSNVDKETSARRFHDMLQFIRDQSGAITLKDVIEACRVALSIKVSTDKTDDNITTGRNLEGSGHLEDNLEDVHAETTDTSLVQLDSQWQIFDSVIARLCNVVELAVTEGDVFTFITVYSALWIIVDVALVRILFERRYLVGLDILHQGIAMIGSIGIADG